MNFLNELEKKEKQHCKPLCEGEFCSRPYECDECNKLELVILKKDVKLLWRSFWLKRKKEVDEEVGEIEIKLDGLGLLYEECCELNGRLERLNEELSWIEKQLKEKEK